MAFLSLFDTLSKWFILGCHSWREWTGLINFYRTCLPNNGGSYKYFVNIHNFEFITENNKKKDSLNYNYKSYINTL